jgi:predicted ArsR family transcriptional regulator
MPAISRVRAMPWVMVLELAVTLRKHWKRLEPDERAELATLVKKSQGRPSRLSAKERTTVRRLVAKLEPAQIARSVVPIGRRAKKARGAR